MSPNLNEQTRTNGPVWAFDKNLGDFRIFNQETEWRNSIDNAGAIQYLKEHLQKSLSNDFSPAYKAYLQTGDAGFFALPRIIFPYITFLGTLYLGYDSSTSAIRYMSQYMADVNHRYRDKQLCGFIYRVYRHGLAHTNMPKVVRANGKTYGWRIVYDDTQHLFIDHHSGLIGKDALLSISPNMLCQEVLESIDYYINDINDDKKLLECFKDGFVSMAKTEHHYFVRRERHPIRVPQAFHRDY